MNILRDRNDQLRAVSIVALVLVLVLPAAMASIGGDRSLPTAGRAPDTGASPTSQTDRFWAGDGSYDVIVTFTKPCVVLWRLDQEHRGTKGDLGAMAVSYRNDLVSDQTAFRASMLDSFPATAFRYGWTTVLDGVALTASSAALDWTAARPDVAGIERDEMVQATLSDSVPLINADDLWATKNATGADITGKGVIVAILDTGIDYSHPDLGGTKSRTNDWANVTGGTHKRIVGGYNTYSSTADFWDGHGHGTHCAGIVGANGTVKGVAPDCKFRIYKVLSDAGWGSSSSVISGVELATDPDSDGDTKDHSNVISMSLGGVGHPDDDECKAVDNAMDAGVVVAVAAANSGSRYETVMSPGCARKVITVGATWKDDTLASFSSVGPTAIYQVKPDVTAPGVYIHSTYKNDGYATMSGTSMATPHVAGAAALLVQSHPGWTSDQVKEALMGSAKDLGYNAYHQGAGRIDVLAANDTFALADPPSVSLGRLSAITNSTDFTVTFTNTRATWTNGTLSVKLRWALTPLYSDTGDATDLSSMVKANTTAVDIGPRGTFKVKFTVTFGPDSHVGHHLGEIELTVGGSAIRIPLEFYLRAAILLVDDDNTGPDSDPPYINWNEDTTSLMYDADSSKSVGDALVSLGYSFDVIAPITAWDGPTRAEMANYRLVIWNCGYDFSPYGLTLTANDQTEIRAYVDAGGRFWLMGSLIMYDTYGAANETSLPHGDFFRDVFGVGALKRHAGTPDPIKGAAGTLFASRSWDVSTTFGGGVDYGQNATPTDGAYQVLSGPTTDLWGGSWVNVTSALARDTGTNKTVLFAFEFAQVNGAADRKACVDDAVSWFSIQPHGKVSLSGSPREGSTVNFTGTVLDPRANERYEFSWDFAYDGSTFVEEAKGADVPHKFADEGNYTVALRVKETRSGLLSPLVLKTVNVINVAPEAHPSSSSPGNEGSPISFWGNVTDPGAGDTFTWEWCFKYDGTTFRVDSTDRNPTHIYVDDGTYTAALRVTDDGGAVSVVNTTNVVVLNVPPTGTIYTQGVSNEGDSVHFTITVTDPGALDFVRVQWDFEYDGTFHEQANGTSVDHVFIDDGTYTVLARLTDDDGGVNNASVKVTVRNLPPVGTFTTTAPADEGDVVDFNSTVTDPGIRDQLTYEWDFEYNGVVFDPSLTTSSINVSNQYLQDGSYVVAMRVRDGDGGELFVTKDVVILNVAPDAIIDGVPVPIPVKEGSPAQFKGKQVDPGVLDTFTYLWDFGDGTNSTAKSPLHTFWDNGTYSVTFKVTDEAGAWGLDTLQVIVVNVAPNATVAVTPDHILENQTVWFQAEGHDPSPRDQAALTYTWNFGDGTFSNEREVYHRYLDDGNYTVTLTVSDGYDLTTFQRNVLVDNVPPSIVATADADHILEGGGVNFTARVTDPSPLDTWTVHWDFGDGATSASTTVFHRFLQQGNYIVLLTVVDDDGGSNTTTFMVAVANVRPTVTADASAESIKEGQSVTFGGSWSDPGQLDTFTTTWDFGDGANSSQPNVTHTYVENGTYTAVFTVTDESGASSSQFFLIEVANVPPSATIVVSEREIDEGGTVVFTAQATDPGALDVITYRWDLGDGSPIVMDRSFSHRYLDNGAYRVVLTVADDDGGRNTTSITITVNNVPPVVKASADRSETTVGREVSFNASATDVSPVDTISYSWNFGDGSTSTSPTPTHVYEAKGNYEVALIVSDDDGGQTLWSTTITVKPDLDGDGVPNNRDDFPNDPTRSKDWAPTYRMLLLIVVIVVAVVAYVLTRRRNRPEP